MLKGGVDIMLIRFNVSNFLSFDELQEFSMIGGKVRSKTEHVEDDRNINLQPCTAQMRLENQI